MKQKHIHRRAQITYNYKRGPIAGKDLIIRF